MQRPPLQLWFEFASTYSYPAAMRAESVAREAGVVLEWRPFLLGPIFAAQGWRDSPFNLYPTKGAYMWHDLARTCERLGLSFRRPSVFPRSGLLAARVACLARDEAWCPQFVRAVYRANFAEDRDISDPSRITGILDAIGQPGAELVDRAQTAVGKAKLREQTDAAIALGIFGAPTFVVGRELFWGNDRLEEAVRWCLR